jgi:trimethylamine-N-oxide reductase (cytochrome c), cytochrome c-type subunit TorC
MNGRFTRWLTPGSPRAKYGLAALVAVGLLAAVGGVVFVAGFNGVMSYTNSLEFCISCHEMRNTVYAEYQQSPHFKNASGVRATCADCHVPHALVPKVEAKLKATNDLLQSVLGTIDTPEKFNDQRARMANIVWSEMVASDSRECRSCHSFDAMDFHKQREAAAKQMEPAALKNETCISCHKGIAHALPDMTAGYKKDFTNLMNESAREGAKANTLFTLVTKPLFLDKPGEPAGNGDGKVLAASKVKILARDGDWLKVEIEGWQQEGAERVLYALRGQRIFTAALGPAAVDKVNRQPAATDPDTGLAWNAATLVAWVSKDALLADDRKLWSYAQDMYNGACGTCHSLREPNYFLANQWAGTMNAMRGRTSLDDEQARFLQKYLQFNAKDTGGNHG